MKSSIGLLILLLLTTELIGQGIRMIDEINAHTEGIGLWWAGHNGWIIKSDTLVVSTDILLDYGERIHETPITAEELATILDISFVTHVHNDHFNQAVSKVLIEKSNCHFVLPESCIQIAEELNMPKTRMHIAKPRESFKLMGIEIQPIRAIHGNANFAIYYEANLQDCGYLININGTSFLQPGDSYLLEDHLFLKHVDVLFFSPTEHNMYIDRSVILINALNPDFIFPQHHGTIVVDEKSRFWAKGYPDEVKIRLSQDLKDRYHILNEGDNVKIK
ncbi:MAG: MBL fold metallo-hydrolase [Saprospiraceae bacterium]|nr:MBL fold metallo-hydrolase [Saprospiraceae bacterium]